MMAKLVDVLTSEMAGAYPELQRQNTDRKNLWLRKKALR